MNIIMAKTGSAAKVIPPNEIFSAIRQNIFPPKFPAIRYVSIYNGARPNFCLHYSPKLTEEFVAEMTKITKRCPEGDLDGHFHR